MAKIVCAVWPLSHSLLEKSPFFVPEKIAGKYRQE
jgi:hypothetical protein